MIHLKASMSFSITSCIVSHLYVPRPRQCNGYRCPPCHQDRGRTLYPEVSPYTSPLGGRGLAHRRDEDVFLPSLRREKINYFLFQYGEMSLCSDELRHHILIIMKLPLTTLNIIQLFLISHFCPYIWRL